MSTLKQEYLTNEEENLGKDLTKSSYTAGGQTNATLITKKWTTFTGNLADYGSGKIRACLIGEMFSILNDTDYILSIFPIETESINNIDDYQFNIAPRSRMVFEAAEDGKLFAYGTSV